MVKIYMKGLALGAILLIASMAALWMMDKQRVNVISAEMQEMGWEMDDSRLFLEYLRQMDAGSEEQCAVMKERVIRQVSRADVLARRIDAYRNANVFNEEYFTIKKTFIYKSFEMFLQFKKLKEECGTDVNYITYFYLENDPDRSGCPDCAVQESIVSMVRDQCPNTWVFALPYNTDMGLVEVVKSQYGIDQVPSLVVNGKEVHRGLADSDAIMPGISCGKNPLE